MTASSTASTAPPASLVQLLDGRASAGEIERHLDGLAPARRLEEMLAVSGRRVGMLFDAVAGAAPVTIEELIPQSTKGTLIYEGRNSLPLFSRFQKRFERLPGGQVVGYNHQTMSFVTGPGYFVVKEPAASGDHKDELLFDYTENPPGEPAGWPAFSANDRGLSKLVYANMRDYCRRVARGIVVGKAYKLGVDQKQFFSLTLAV